MKRRDQHPARSRHCAVAACITSAIRVNGLLWFSATVVMAAEDVVIVSAASDRSQRIRKTGEIIDFTGQQLTLRTAGGGELAIPSERVIDVLTFLGPDQRRADQLLAARRFAEAAELYRQAQSREQRVWVRRRIVVQRVWCYRHLEQHDRAAELFLVLFQSDPSTQYIAAVPLGWRSQQPPATLEHRAISWLRGSEDNRADKHTNDSRDAMAALIGASWLLPTALRGESVSVLQQLRLHANPTIARLSEAQLWRSEIVTATLQDVASWRSALDELPRSLRAGPYFIIGQALSRHGRHEEAALVWMRVPILYPRQRALAGDCLLAAGNAMEKLNQFDEAGMIYREIVRDYPELSTAGLAKSKLDLIQPRNDL